MIVEKLGEGEPEYAVMVGVHGEEPCGRKAWEKFKSKNFDLQKPVKCVIANPEALEKRERYVDVDLNRVYPGDEDSDRHEERRAAEILEELDGLKVLDIHSTKSEPVPFGIVSNPNEKILELAASTGVKNFADFSEKGEGLITGLDAVCVETGPNGSEEAVEMAYSVLTNFLAAEGVIDREYERSDPDIFRVKGEVDGEGYEFVAENFQKVEKGEVFARKTGEELRAEESFYPVLMSTDGYDKIIGFKAQK